MSLEEFCEKVVDLMDEYTGMTFDYYLTKEGVTLKYYFDGRNILNVEIDEEVRFVYFDCSELRLNLKEVFKRI